MEVGQKASRASEPFVWPASRIGAFDMFSWAVRFDRGLFWIYASGQRAAIFLFKRSHNANRKVGFGRRHHSDL